MRVGLFAAAMLVAGCSADQYLITPPPFDPALKSAVFAFNGGDHALPPDQIEAFDLEDQFPSFGFRSEIITGSGTVFAFGYDRSLSQLDLIPGAVVAPSKPVPCELIQPIERYSYSLERGLWEEGGQAIGAMEFLNGSLTCINPKACRNPEFTRSTQLPSDFPVKVLHRLAQDQFMLGGGPTIAIVEPDRFDTDTAAFWDTLPRDGSVPSTNGQVWMHSARHVALVDLAAEQIVHTSTLGAFKIFGVAPSPSGRRALAITSNYRQANLSPPYTVEVWLNDNGSWSRIFAIGELELLRTTASPIAWRSETEAFLVQKGTVQGVLLHFLDDVVSLVTEVPRPGGVAADTQGNVYVGSVAGNAYHYRESVGWTDIGGELIETMHAMLPLDEGVMITGFGGRIQEVYLDGRLCPFRSVAGGVVTRASRNGSGFAVAGVQPSFLVWTD